MMVGAAPLLLAALVSPALMWTGFAAVSAPILIHILVRRRYRRVPWAAMQFLFEAERQSRRRMRLEELILLALRCLIVALLGLLLARPFIRPAGVAAMLGGAERTERIVLIDDSMSMGYRSENETVFQTGRRNVIRLLERVREQAPGDTITVFRTSQMEQPFVAGAVADEEQIEKLLARIEALSPTSLALDADACMAALGDYLSAQSTAVNVAVYVVSDFQRIDWIERGGANAAALVEPLRRWAGDDRSIHLTLLDVGDDRAENVALMDVRTADRQVIAGVESRLRIRAANYAPAAHNDIELQVFAGQTPEASARLENLPAGQTADVVAPVVFSRAGEQAVRVETAPDNLPLDNVRFAAVEVREAVDILVVNGEPSADPYLDEAHLLVTALRPGGPVPSGNRVDVVTDAELEGLRLADYQLVILCNLYRVSEPAADALHRYVRDGGGLAVFLGDQVVDADSWNAALYRNGEGVLPAALETVVTAPAEGVSLAPGEANHPIMRVFSGADNPFLKGLRFYRYFAVTPAEATDGDESTVAEDAPNPTTARFRPSARIVARYADGEQSPAIIERPYGKGRVMLFTSSCDLEWNDWPKDASYVVSMLEVAQYLARAAEAGGAVLAGQPLELELDPSRFLPTATVRPPGYPQQAEVETSATPSDAGGLKFEWPHTGQVGVYAIMLRERGGAEHVRRFAVNVDPDESQLAPAMEDELKRAFEGVPTEYVEGLLAETGLDDAGRRELWKSIWVALLALLAIEQFLAWRFGRR